MPKCGLNDTQIPRLLPQPVSEGVPQRVHGSRSGAPGQRDESMEALLRLPG